MWSAIDKRIGNRCCILQAQYLANPYYWLLEFQYLLDGSVGQIA